MKKLVSGLSGTEVILNEPFKIGDHNADLRLEKTSDRNYPFVRALQFGWDLKAQRVATVSPSHACYPVEKLLKDGLEKFPLLSK